MKDDRDVLFDKIKTSDGVILATPNYKLADVWPHENLSRPIRFRYSPTTLFWKGIHGYRHAGHWTGKEILTRREYIRNYETCDLTHKVDALATLWVKSQDQGGLKNWQYQSEGTP